MGFIFSGTPCRMSDLEISGIVLFFLLICVIVFAYSQSRICYVAALIYGKQPITSFKWPLSLYELVAPFRLFSIMFARIRTGHTDRKIY